MVFRRRLQPLGSPERQMPVILGKQQNGGAVPGQNRAGSTEQLAQRIIEREIAEGGVGDRLDGAQPLGRCLRFGARGMRMRQILLTLFLGGLACRDVAKIDDNRLHARFGKEVIRGAFQPAPGAVLVLIAKLAAQTGSGGLAQL